MLKKSAPYKLDGKLFRYNFTTSSVEYIEKAATKDIASEKNSMKVHKGNSPLDIGTDGYMVIDTIGLSRENWNDREARNAYLEGWSSDLDEETSYLAEQFIRYELPYV